MVIQFSASRISLQARSLQLQSPLLLLLESMEVISETLTKLAFFFLNPYHCLFSLQSGFNAKETLGGTQNYAQFYSVHSKFCVLWLTRKVMVMSILCQLLKSSISQQFIKIKV